MSDYYKSLFDIEGKVAVITGAGGYLCGAMARGLAKAGCSVVVLDSRIEKASKVAEEINQSGDKAAAFAVDVSKKDELRKALDFTLEQYGVVDILVNGAGTNCPTPFFDLTLDEWNSVLDSQLTGTFLSSQIFGKKMVDQGSGSIINISSASAGPPLSKAFAYSVAKAGIKNLTQNLAREWAQAGVRVNAIRPGFFPTQWNRENFITEEREKAILGHTPMARYGEVEELVGAVIWLASDAASFVTGSEVAIDGGFGCMTI